MDINEKIAGEITMIKLPENYASAVIDETFMEFVDTLDHYTYRNGVLYIISYSGLFTLNE